MLIVKHHSQELLIKTWCFIWGPWCWRRWGLPKGLTDEAGDEHLWWFLHSATRRLRSPFFPQTIMSGGANLFTDFFHLSEDLATSPRPTFFSLFQVSIVNLSATSYLICVILLLTGASEQNSQPQRREKCPPACSFFSGWVVFLQKLVTFMGIQPSPHKEMTTLLMIPWEIHLEEVGSTVLAGDIRTLHGNLPYSRYSCLKSRVPAWVSLTEPTLSGKSAPLHLVRLAIISRNCSHSTLRIFWMIAVQSSVIPIHLFQIFEGWSFNAHTSPLQMWAGLQRGVISWLTLLAFSPPMARL